jgi:hypothetical protein
MSSVKRLLKRVQYWLYVKSGLRKRDEDNWWKGACHAHSVHGLHARIEWTRKMRPEWTWEEARERVRRSYDPAEL